MDNLQMSVPKNYYDTLKKDGFVQVDYSAGVWTFLQCKEKYEDTKSKINETKISFSNTLNI